MNDDLVAMQIVHESQSIPMARDVGSTKFKDSIRLWGTKLTIVDIMALTFLLENNDTMHTLLYVIYLLAVLTRVNIIICIYRNTFVYE